MGEAAFRFLGYKFTKIAFDFNNVYFCAICLGNAESSF